MLFTSIQKKGADVGPIAKGRNAGSNPASSTMKNEDTSVGLAAVVLIVAALLTLLFIFGCDNPTKWKDQGPVCALDCELKNTLWERDYNGVVWQWLFKESTFLAGRKGLLNPIVGSWRVENSLLEVSDNACVDFNGMRIVGQYIAHIKDGRLEIGPFADACTPRLMTLPGVWNAAHQEGAPKHQVPPDNGRLAWPQ